jgi:hypothetical protein
MKRMAKRHPIMIAVGVPAIFTSAGVNKLKLNEGERYNFFHEVDLYIGGTPTSHLEGHVFNYCPLVTGKSIYIERISKIDVSKEAKKIEYRILTDRWD